MQNIIPDHRRQVLAQLRALDPVQVQLGNRLAERTPRRLLRWAHSLIEALERRRQRRATIRVLDALSDWQLADIGIRREAIPAAVDLALANSGKPALPPKAPPAAPHRLAA